MYLLDWLRLLLFMDYLLRLVRLQYQFLTSIDKTLLTLFPIFLLLLFLLLLLLSHLLLQPLPPQIPPFQISHQILPQSLLLKHHNSNTLSSLIKQLCQLIHTLLQWSHRQPQTNHPKITNTLLRQRYIPHTQMFIQCRSQILLQMITIIHLTLHLHPSS